MTEKPFRPLLAATIENNEQLEHLAYPMIASPKVDGIRIICHPALGPVTRTLKPVRNRFINSQLNQLIYAGLDGEVVSGPITAVDVFNRTTSAVMTADGQPEFTYWVFDYIGTSTEVLGLTYWNRLAYIEGKLENDFLTPCARLLPYRIVKNPSEVLEAEIEWLGQGFEGIMLRHPAGKYKWGRSTLKEQTLLKLKRFTDAEAEIIGFTALESNQNPQTRNSQGLAERSDHKAGKVQIETLGNLIVRCRTGRFGDFSIGSGFDASTRDTIWRNRERYLGKTVTYKFQEIGIVEKPRFPIFLRFREPE